MVSKMVSKIVSKMGSKMVYAGDVVLVLGSAIVGNVSVSPPTTAGLHAHGVRVIAAYTWC